jgi:para-aminobenzoate synthetase/4-amino-4-deoxychorismate lyase
MNRTPDFVYESHAVHLALHNPVTVFTAHTLDEVIPALAEADACVSRGQTAAGYIAYEAAPAFDPALQCHPAGEFPLVWIAVFDETHETSPPATPASYRFGEWRASVTEHEYHAALGAIREWIGAGETYQINYTYPLTASFDGAAYAAYESLRNAQGGGHTAYIDTGEFQIVSASPELFFHLDNRCITSRPMKGTRPRGLWSAQDQSLADELQCSEKDRAENVMIVDMIRNDVGRIADPGTVAVDDLFAIEQYPTVWQMTSTVQANTKRSVPDILAAMFPCASVTGAPKVQTMRRIKELESEPRGAYCGAIGWWRPDGTAEFNVAIRTMTVDHGTARYHVGSGIVWDSVPQDEFNECVTKAAILNVTQPDFELLESLLFDDDFFLLDEHLNRLEESARYFDIPLNIETIRAQLIAESAKWRDARKVRLLINHAGGIYIESAPLGETPSLKLGVASTRVDSGDRFLYHKTTHRAVYDDALASQPDCDDVLLINERGELSESTRANLVVQIGDALYTPPVECGLLAGVMRDQLIATRRITERVLYPNDLDAADGIWLINSVRKWIDVEYTDTKSSDHPQPASADAP